MDIKAYIESGVLELYAMEALSPVEARAVEAIAQQYPEVKREIARVQDALNAYVLLHAQEPKPSLKQAIIDKVQVSALPVAAPRRGRLIFLILFLVSIVLAGFFLYKWKYTEQELARVVVEKRALETENEVFAAQLNVVENPATKAIRLKGLPIAPTSEVVVYWNATEQSTFLAIKNLPQAPPGKQYQLWAIVQGKAQDAGVFNSTLFDLQSMKKIGQAEQFAVTLENEGGSPSPQGDMYLQAEI